MPTTANPSPQSPTKLISPPPSGRSRTRRRRGLRSLWRWQFAGLIGFAMLPLGFAVAVATLAAPATAISRPTYEYRCLKRNVDVTRHLNRLGARGWQLVASAGGPGFVEPASESTPLSSSSGNEESPWGAKTVEEFGAMAGAVVKDWVREGGAGVDPDERTNTLVKKIEGLVAEKVASEMVRAVTSNLIPKTTAPTLVWCLMRPR